MTGGQCAAGRGGDSHGDLHRPLMAVKASECSVFKSTILSFLIYYSTLLIYKYLEGLGFVLLLLGRTNFLHVRQVVCH